MKELIDFWNTLSGGNKHFGEKYSNWGNFVHKELITRVKEPIKNVVDYGCGEGWTLLNLPEDTHFYLLDICQDSLDNAEANLSF